MQKEDFIELILKKKTIDKEIFQLSLKIEDYPVAREILKKIENNYNFNNLIKSRNLIKISSASADLKAQLPSIIKDSFLRNEIDKFINDITNKKILGINQVNKNDLYKEQKSPAPVRKQQLKNTSQKNTTKVIKGVDKEQKSPAPVRKQQLRNTSQKNTTKVIKGVDKEQKPPAPVRKQQSKNTKIKNMYFDPEILKDQEIKILKQKIIKKEEDIKEWDDAFSGILIIGTILAPIIFIAGCYYGENRRGNVFSFQSRVEKMNNLVIL